MRTPFRTSTSPGLFLRATFAACIALACSSSSSQTAPATDYATQAKLGVAAMQQWYSEDTGLYAKPTGWWNSANAMTVLDNYALVTGDHSNDAVLANTFTKAQQGKDGAANFLNEYYDDEGWWALAWIGAYDLTHEARYLAMAKTIFADMAASWDDTCHGGIWWSKERKYKNAIANELFLSVAASLANRTTGAEAAGFRTWATREWAWFQGSGMINAQHLINDGLVSKDPEHCTNNQGNTWSYNQGVVLGGLVELSKATGDTSLLHEATTIADAVLASPLVNDKGVLVDKTVHGGDAPQFKGIFARNLMALYPASPKPAYRSFARTNADSLLANDADEQHRFGGLWQGPVDSTDATRQASALDMLIASSRMHQKP